MCAQLPSAVKALIDHNNQYSSDLHLELTMDFHPSAGLFQATSFTVPALAAKAMHLYPLTPSPRRNYNGEAVFSRASRRVAR